MLFLNLQRWKMSEEQHAIFAKTDKCDDDLQAYKRRLATKAKTFRKIIAGYSYCQSLRMTTAQYRYGTTGIHKQLHAGEAT